MRTLHKFESWDKVDDDIKWFRQREGFQDGFEISAWAFADYGHCEPQFWHCTNEEELCYLPAGVWIAVISGERIDKKECTYPSPMAELFSDECENLTCPKCGWFEVAQ